MTSSETETQDPVQAEYVAWRAPEVREPPLDSEGPPDPKQAYEAAYAKGLQDGRAAGHSAGQNDINAALSTFESVLNTLARPLEELEVRVEEEIVALVSAVCQQLVRREFKQQPEHLLGIIREGLQALPVADDAPVIRLNPDDLKVIEKTLTAEADCPWRLEPDPLLERGGCLIRSADSQIDGRLETRLGRVIATLLDGERSADQTAENTENE